MSQSFAWDPERYSAFVDERGRPFLDLVTRIGATSPRTVVDLGCGTGNLTMLLSVRWPGADSGNRSLTFDTGAKKWTTFAFEWPGTLVVKDARGCMARVDRNSGN